MDIAIGILLGLGALCILSTLGICAYGHFARRERGRPSYALLKKPGHTVLDRLVSSLTATHPSRCGVILSSSNVHAFTARMLSARAAERSLDVQYYYWKDDFIGTLMAKEVLAAADRGVRVRMLFDDISLHGKDSKYLSLHAHPNVEVRVFNPCWNRSGALQRGLEVLLRAYSATRRMHNKSWVADGRLAIVGGRNIADAYFDASDQVNFHDLDLIIIGGVVDKVEATFDSFWNSTCVLPLASLPGFERGDLTWLRNRCAAAAASEKARSYYPEQETEPTIEMMLAGKMHWVERIQIVSDPPAKWIGEDKHRWLYKAILPLITSAKKKVELTSPYFIPGEKGVRQLLQLVQEGVDVTVLTNSLAATDVAAVHGAYARYREALIRGGVMLYELRPEPQKPRMSLFGSSGASLHTKAFAVDDHLGFVGSFNFDARSVSLNTEMGVLYSRDLALKQIGRFGWETTYTYNFLRASLHVGNVVWVVMPVALVWILGGAMPV